MWPLLSSPPAQTVIGPCAGASSPAYTRLVLVAAWRVGTLAPHDLLAVPAAAALATSSRIRREADGSGISRALKPERLRTVGCKVSAAVPYSARFASSGCDARHQLRGCDDGNPLIRFQGEEIAVP
jgi:hypothetical protein